MLNSLGILLLWGIPLIINAIAYTHKTVHEYDNDVRAVRLGYPTKLTYRNLVLRFLASVVPILNFSIALRWVIEFIVVSTIWLDKPVVSKITAEEHSKFVRKV